MRTTTLAMVLTLAVCLPAGAQQFRNTKVQPDGTGGYLGTYGNQNFEVRPEGGGVSGHIGGRRPGVIEERPSRRPGSIGATQRNCVLDGNANAICR